MTTRPSVDQARAIDRMYEDPRYILAVRVLQSDLYGSDDDARQATDALMAAVRAEYGIKAAPPKLSEVYIARHQLDHGNATWWTGPAGLPDPVKFREVSEAADAEIAALREEVAQLRADAENISELRRNHDALSTAIVDFMSHARGTIMEFCNKHGAILK